jgi:hypothetical protein
MGLDIDWDGSISGRTSIVIPSYCSGEIDNTMPIGPHPLGIHMYWDDDKQFLLFKSVAYVDYITIFSFSPVTILRNWLTFLEQEHRP